MICLHDRRYNCFYIRYAIYPTSLSFNTIPFVLLFRIVVPWMPPIEKSAVNF